MRRVIQIISIFLMFLPQAKANNCTVLKTVAFMRVETDLTDLRQTTPSVEALFKLRDEVVIEAKAQYGDSWMDEVKAAAGKTGASIAQTGKYSFATIANETGFVDLLPNLLQKEGLTMDDFRYMMQKNINALTDAEKAKLANIRNALPKPDANTLMQKVVPKTDIEKYINPPNSYYNQIGGYVSTAADAKQLKTFDDLYYGERLDYTDTKFFLNAGSCGEIRFKNVRSSEVVIPMGSQYNGYDYPFTANGFTSGTNGRIGIPEWHFPNSIDFSEGDEIWEIFNDGTEKLRAVYKMDNGKLKFVEIK